MSDEKKRRMYDSGQDLDDAGGHGYQDIDPNILSQEIRKKLKLKENI